MNTEDHEEYEEHLQEMLSLVREFGGINTYPQSGRTAHEALKELERRGFVQEDVVAWKLVEKAT